MKEVKLTVVIKRPAHEVFDFTLNPENTPKWIDGIVKEEADPLPARIGTVYRNQNRQGQWTEYEITALEAGSMFVLSRKDGAYHVKYTLTPTKGHTELEYLEWTDEGELEDPFTQEPLQKLKQVMEAPRRYLITLKSGQQHVTGEFDSDEAVQRWLNTGLAGIVYGSENVRIFPDDIANLQRIEDENEAE